MKEQVNEVKRKSMKGGLRGLVTMGLASLAVTVASQDAAAEGHAAGAVVKHNLQTHQTSGQVYGVFNNGAAYAAVTSPLNEGAKDPANSVLEFSMATQAANGGKVSSHMLPQNAYVTANGDGTGVGVGAQWVAPSIGNDKVGVSGNAWAVYYPGAKGEDMFFLQGNVGIDTKKSGADNALVFAGKSLIPSKVKANVIAAGGEVDLAEVEATWGQGALKSKLAGKGTAGKIVGAIIPDNITASVDGKGKIKNVGGEYGIGF
jgi:hypothetical protein